MPYMVGSPVRDVAGIVGLYAASVASIVVFWEDNLLLTVLFVFYALVAHRLWPRAQNAALFAAGALLGPTAEAVAVSAGVWAYANPTGAGIPLWLPVAWGTASLLVVSVAEVAHRLVSGK